ncbi:hypothetical protein T458_04335 [Brevibacillus panacihumi W25]|uniref:Uncharacterized protein n=1 Tax=Brevibacillus panacihumi W25 TaxID=1408254 RepID=V6ME11_9BACL|nr:hypothetical protein T458_04335 [Brevibacillus panacihumi W25]
MLAEDDLTKDISEDRSEQMSEWLALVTGRRIARVMGLQVEGSRMFIMRDLQTGWHHGG